MTSSIRRLAIIPIRSGSKGLKDKNIKLLNGKPLVFYTIRTALNSDSFDRVLVSTDSEKYADIAEECGATVPFLRSVEMSSDTASSWDVVREVLDNLSNKFNESYDEIMLLQATSPLRTVEDIKKSISLMRKMNANAVESVVEMDHSPLWADVLPEDNCMDHFAENDYSDLPRQLLPKYYRLNGAIYLIKQNELERKEMFRNRCFAYIMPQDRSIDIDTELDFKIAEIYMKEHIL